MHLPARITKCTTVKSFNGPNLVEKCMSDSIFVHIEPEPAGTEIEKGISVEPEWRWTVKSPSVVLQYFATTVDKRCSVPCSRISQILRLL